MSLENKRKNKKRKSFLQNARKYAKKGRFGRGSYMEADTYNYFVRILEVYNEGFDSDEDKSVFVNNAFEQIIDHEVDYSCNQLGSRIIETLIPFVNNEYFQRFCKACSEDLRPLCSDNYAAHVIECLVRESCKKYLLDDTNTFCHDFVVKVSKFLLNNVEDYMWDTYGNHVMRTCLLSLSQIPKEEKKVTIEEMKQEPINLPNDFVEIVKDYGERLISWPQFNEMCHNEKTSGFIQVLLRALNKVDKKLVKRYIKKLLDEILTPDNEDNKNLCPAFSSMPLLMLLETCLVLNRQKMYHKIYERCFKGRLSKLSTTKMFIHSMEKLISHCKDKFIFEEIFDELSPHFETIIEAGFTGIILCLGQGCKRLATRQGLYVQNLMKCLNCAEPKENEKYFVLCMSRFKNLEETKKLSNENLQTEKLNLHGTLCVQVMLEFNKPIKIVLSILDMDVNDLKNLFSNSMGSHIINSYVDSEFIGEKNREKLVRKMIGHYQELASSKYGSRAFDALWKSANLKNRLIIMDELSHKDAAWSNTLFGKIIKSKVNLVLYNRNKEEWKNYLNQTCNKVEKVFEDVLK